MAEEITRNIPHQIERELWTRAAGRCEFNGCNKLLYKSPITQEKINIAQKAHIYSFSKGGPRGRGPYSGDGKGLNSTDNLMLMCHGCHKLIDEDKKGNKYSSELLQEWKSKHEKRIKIVTGVDPSKQSHVVHFRSPIGEFIPTWENLESYKAIFPNRFPAEEQPIDLSMQMSEEDPSGAAYQTLEKQLRTVFSRRIMERIEDGSIKHISLFGWASQPLLFLLGKLFGNIIPMCVYQRHREPEQTWIWPEEGEIIDFKIQRPEKKSNEKVVLLFALSADIPEVEISNALKNDKFDLWKIYIDTPSVNYMQSRESLSKLYKLIGIIYDEIKNYYGDQKELHIMPVMSNASAIMAGRALMQKTNMPVIIYDKVNIGDKKVFIPCLNI